MFAKEQALCARLKAVHYRSVYRTRPQLRCGPDCIVKAQWEHGCLSWIVNLLCYGHLSSPPASHVQGNSLATCIATGGTSRGVSAAFKCTVTNKVFHACCTDILILIPSLLVPVQRGRMDQPLGISKQVSRSVETSLAVIYLPKVPS